MLLGVPPKPEKVVEPADIIVRTATSPIADPAGIAIAVEGEPVEE
jgi:hypothetical protein